MQRRRCSATLAIARLSAFDVAMTDEDDLHRAYALGSPDAARRLYADWAASYDSDFVDARGYVLHIAVADAFVQAGGRGPVLDIGAGTGVCGQVLAQRGVRGIDAADIAPEMLAKAEARRVYARCFVGDVLAGLDAPDAHYNGIVSSGTFTCGHVGPDGLDEIARLLAPGGLAVISVRDVHFEAEGFAAKIAALEPVLTLEQQPETRIYAEGASGENTDDLALLLHLRKR